MVVLQLVHWVMDLFLVDTGGGGGGDGDDGAAGTAATAGV